MVRAHEVAPVLPATLERRAARPRPVPGLRRPRLLSAEERRRALSRLAAEHGFDAVGVARPDALPELPERLGAWLAAGAHGDMAWMASRAPERADPARLWPEVRSVVMLGLSAAPEENPLEKLAERSRGLVAAYAQGADYHDVVKPRLKAIARALLEASGEGDAKVFVDTAPLMEKPLAAAAGLGWQGKHTVLVSRAHGSWLVLGAILTTLDIAPDAPHAERCGTCTRCLDACPTAAFPAPFQLDARRCLAYLTIEHKGPIPREFRSVMGNRVFGCDDCLAVCPWNRFAAAARDQKLTARRDIGLMPLSELLALDDAGFRALFAKTPVKRTGRARFVRNCLVAAGNSGDPALAAPVRALLADAEPLVRGAAVWALARLDPAALAAEGWRAGHEADPAVAAEWRAELPVDISAGRASTSANHLRTPAPDPIRA
jgi:epoxyqueuosine reductase